MEPNKAGHHVSLGRWELPIELLVIANLIALAFETLPDLSPFWRQALWSFEVFCAAVYTVEYGIRLYLARPRLKYVTSFYGIIDLLAILPFYLMTAFNLQAVRAFRLMRLLRLFKLVRYTQATHRFKRAFEIARDDLVLFGITALIVLYLAAIGIFHFEHDAQPDKFTSVFDSLWWAVSTLTTVGYGDIYPDHRGRQAVYLRRARAGPRCHCRAFGPDGIGTFACAGRGSGPPRGCSRKDPGAQLV